VRDRIEGALLGAILFLALWVIARC